MKDQGNFRNRLAEAFRAPEASTLMAGKYDRKTTPQA
jgi:hypothetical protein